MRILILGLTITSSWGNGHATTYRALCSALQRRGHTIKFLEKDVEWYRNHRDLPQPSCCELRLYEFWGSESDWLLREARTADVVVVGSYFSDAIAAIDLLAERCTTPTVFYDIDTPITLAALRKHNQVEYVRADQIPLFGAYLSFSGGPVLNELQATFGARRAAAMYCSVDCAAYKPTNLVPRFQCDLSYLGTYAVDRQAKVLDLLNAPAASMPQQSFIVAGPQYPETPWGTNVRRIDHVPPGDHPAFYSSSRFTLNLTRSDMIEAGYSPSVRLFEAAACGSPIISDLWKGLDTFFQSHEQILVAETTQDVIDILTNLSESERTRLAESARQQVLEKHTSDQRALEFEKTVENLYSLHNQ